MGAGAQILLAEDNRADVFLIREALAVHGIAATLHVVEDGEAAIHYLARVDADEASTCPALILLDLNLPRRSGRDVLAHLRRSRKCADAPVIIVTSSDAEVDRVETARLGANEFFRKPSTYDQFLKIGQMVREVLEKSPPGLS